MGSAATVAERADPDRVAPLAAGADDSHAGGAGRLCAVGWRIGLVILLVVAALAVVVVTNSDDALGHCPHSAIECQ